MMKKILFALSCITFSGLAFAENCDHARNTYDAVHCDNKVYANADNELNKNYQLLRTKLNTEQKNILKRSNSHGYEIVIVHVLETVVLEK